MYDPYIGPTSNPPVVAQAHQYINHTRCFILYISSILPDTITEGTADIKPDRNLPTTAPAADGVTPTMMHDMQYERAEKIYTDFRPNASEYGGKRTPPKAWPNWYLKMLVNPKQWEVFAWSTHMLPKLTRAIVRLSPYSVLATSATEG
jgi:hypothetical protein